MRRILPAALLVIAWAAPAAAQGGTLEARVAPGLVWAAGVFGDDSPKSVSAVRPVISAIVRGSAHRRFGWTFEAMLEPLGLANPHFDEQLHSLHVLAGVEIGRGIYVRPAFGAGLQVWTGLYAEQGLGIGPAAGLAIGHRHMPPPGEGPGQWRRVHISPELIARTSFTRGALSAFVGVQVPVTWRK